MSRIVPKDYYKSLGAGKTGPLGVKAIICHLNERRFFTRDGGRWGLTQIRAILTRTTYIGQHRFNTRTHKNREKKPESEHSEGEE